MKKLLSVIMLVCIVASMCTVSACATGTPTATVVGGASFTSLADALNAAPTGSTIELSSGAYNITSVSNKALTIKAAANTDRLSVVINISGTPAFHGCSLSFSGVTLVCENTDYRGMQHLSSLTVDNCVIKNQFFSYAPTASFSGCTFEQPSAGNYNIWTYNSGNISFTNCQFNSAGKSMLVYHEGTSTKTVNVSACMFNNTASSAVAGKAAIELDSTFHQIILNIDTQTAASGFDANSLCGNELWNEKANNGTGVQGGQATVVKNGAKIYENKTYIAMPPVDPNPDPGVNPNPNNPAPVTPAAPVVEDIYYIPATDDNSNMALWSILALALLSTAFVTRKRKNEN